MILRCKKNRRKINRLNILWERERSSWVHRKNINNNWSQCVVQRLHVCSHKLRNLLWLPVAWKFDVTNDVVIQSIPWILAVLGRIKSSAHRNRSETQRIRYNSKPTRLSRCEMQLIFRNDFVNHRNYSWDKVEDPYRKSSEYSLERMFNVLFIATDSHEKKKWAYRLWPAIFRLMKQKITYLNINLFEWGRRRGQFPK